MSRERDLIALALDGIAKQNVYALQSFIAAATEYLEETADFGDAFDRDAQRRELPAYQRSVPGVVLVGARAE